MKLKKVKTVDHTISRNEWTSSTLHQDIVHAKAEMEDAYNNFQNTSDPDLIDYYILKGDAAFKRYQHLLKQAKVAN